MRRSGYQDCPRAAGEAGNAGDLRSARCARQRRRLRRLRPPPRAGPPTRAHGAPRAAPLRPACFLGLLALNQHPSQRVSRRTQQRRRQWRRRRTRARGSDERRSSRRRLRWTVEWGRASRRRHRRRIQEARATRGASDGRGKFIMDRTLEERYNDTMLRTRALSRGVSSWGPPRSRRRPRRRRRRHR